MRLWILFLLAAVVLIGCVQKECSVKADCMHKQHADCAGVWECIDSSCVYDCSKILNSTAPAQEAPLEISITSFASDKPEYGSSESVQFSVTANSSRATNATLVVKGINPGAYYFIDKSKAFSLEKGLNELTINAVTPRCTSGCGGVHPGNYTMTAEIDVDETAMAKMNATLALHS